MKEGGACRVLAHAVAVQGKEEAVVEGFVSVAPGDVDRADGFLGGSAIWSGDPRHGQGGARAKEMQGSVCHGPGAFGTDGPVKR